MATITATGLQFMAKLINGVSTAPMKYIALGSGTGTESTTDTTLGTEITTNGGARAQATCTYDNSGGNNYTKWDYTWNFTGTLAINETAIFDANSAGNMLMRHKFAATINVQNGDSLQVTVTCNNTAS